MLQVFSKALAAVTRDILTSKLEKEAELSYEEGAQLVGKLQLSIQGYKDNLIRKSDLDLVLFNIFTKRDG